MKIGVLGRGMVGTAIATRLIEVGHDVMIGTREPFDESSSRWVSSTGKHAAAGKYAAAAAFGEMVFNCTMGAWSLAALQEAGEDNLADKILIDVANPYDYSRGFPPRLTVCNDDSLAEQIQRAFPATSVVKALNTVSSEVMAAPESLQEDHDIFICGNDLLAKRRVAGILREWFGWRRIIDLGDITMARGTEAYAALWVRLCQALGTVRFNVRIVTQR